MKRSDLFIALALGAAVSACVQASSGAGEDGTGGATGGGSGGAGGNTTSGGSGGQTASSAGGQTGSGAATGVGGATSSLGGKTGSGGSTTGGGMGGATSSLGGFTGTGLPPVVPEFTDDFEDGNLAAPPVKWLSTTHDATDTSMWSIITDGSKVVSQSLPAAETEMVSGDYRWKDASMEAKVKLTSPDNRAGVCVRYKSAREKYCAYLEQLAMDSSGVVNWAMELRMRSDKGSAGSLPKVKGKDLGLPITVSLTGFNTVKLEVHGGVYTASLNGTVVFTFTDSANLVDTGGVAMATQNQGTAEFDDAHAVPF